MGEEVFNGVSMSDGGVVFDGEQVPSHFGNPFREEEELREGRAFTDLSFLEAVEVSGPDRLSWLHNFATADFLSATPGMSFETIILDPNGHIDFAAAVAVRDEALMLIVDRGEVQRLFAFLESMKFMLRVENTVREIAVFGTQTSAAQVPDSARKLAAAVWEDPWPHTSPGGAHYGIPDEEHPAFHHHRTLIIADSSRHDDVRAALSAAGFTPAGFMAWEASRIVDFRPRPATEIVERALPHELDWIRTAVHLNKGCYRGQETVAKLVNLGKPPRRLVFLYLEGGENDLPPHGTPVKLGERPVGVVTSSARDAEAGPVALAIIKRTVKLGDVLTVGEFIATQEAIVDPQGKSSVSPQERPGAEFRQAQRLSEFGAR
ncbi:MAG: folate-binding protein [Actinomycetaceae bacterium]|nr:folate-binding protein [Arcanobacterium sp.]MDD7504910.1 folate-binding protein [Actinomycetaceae bacterium]MDY6143256.1 folate-binding protein [Arcanobacterium sp.]